MQNNKNNNKWHTHTHKLSVKSLKLIKKLSNVKHNIVLLLLFNKRLLIFITNSPQRVSKSNQGLFNQNEMRQLKNYHFLISRLVYLWRTLKSLYEIYSFTQEYFEIIWFLSIKSSETNNCGNFLCSLLLAVMY